MTDLPIADEFADLPTCLAPGCQLPYIPNPRETIHTGLCPPCNDLYLIGSQMDHLAGAVPRGLQTSPPRPDTISCGTCGNWFKPDKEPVCGGCLDTVEWARDTLNAVKQLDHHQPTTDWDNDTLTDTLRSAEAACDRIDTSGPRSPADQAHRHDLDLQPPTAGDDDGPVV